MNIKTHCSNPECGHEYNLSTEHLGKTVRCKKCQQTFTVMDSNAEATGASRVATPTPAVEASTRKGGKSQTGEAPLKLGRFEVREKLGSGAFGFVYRAFDPQLEREVALKIPRPGTLDRKGAVQRFLREAKAAAQLRHPNIVPIYDAGRDGEQYYIASAFISGHPLDQVVSKSAMEPRRAARLVRELAEAFEYAHGEGIIHRDIKPANVMLDEKDHPHVMDFGLARFDTDDSKLTKDGAVMGTPSYMSPEQAMGQNDRVTAASDQYSLGVLFYELLTSQTPFSGPPHVVIVNVLKTPPPAPRSIKPDIPRDLETICLKAMAKESERRYGSCREFAEDLRRWLDGEPITARRVSHIERLVRWCQRNRVVASLIATAALLLLVVAAVSTVSAVRLSALATREREQTNRANKEADNAKNERFKALELATANSKLAESEKEAADVARQETKRAKQFLYSAHMNLAQHAWEDGRVNTMNDLLDRWRPAQPTQNSPATNNPNTDQTPTTEDDLRGFEWHYLNRISHSWLMELKGHPFNVSSVAFSPDGKHLASGGHTTVKLWNVQKGTETLTLTGSTNAPRMLSSDDPHMVSSVAFRPDGKRLAAAGNGSVRIWDATSGTEILSFKWRIHSSPDPTPIVFSPDGRQLASGGRAGGVQLWDVSNNREMLAWQVQNEQSGSQVNSLDFSPDGELLASASHGGDQAVNVWNTSTRQKTIALNGSSGATSVGFSPDGKQLASASGDQVKVWDVISGEEKVTLKGHTGAVVKTVFSSDGRRLASAGDDQSIKVWDSTTGEETLTLKGHAGRVNSIDFSPDGRRLVSGSSDATVKVWDSTCDQEKLSMKSASFSGVAFSPDGKRLVHGNRLWDTSSGQEILSFKGNTPLGAVYSVAFSPDGRRFASGGFDKTIRLWDSVSGQELVTLTGHTDPVYFIAFSRDGKRLASATRGFRGLVKVWDTDTGEDKITLNVEHPNTVAFSPDGKRLAAGSDYHTVQVWDSANGQGRLTINGDGFSGLADTSVVFSPDGKLIASVRMDKTVAIWDALSGQEVLALKGHYGEVSGIAFSPDGRRLACADGTIRFWDTTSGQQVLVLKERANSIRRVAFSADGRRLAAAGRDTLYVWDARPWTFELKSEFEALGVVRFLFGKGLTKDAVLKAIASDETITEPVRKQATDLAIRWAENVTRAATP